eukprot:scaffold19322_cov109-Phaeocystis_antarctica.AAC.1
MPFIGSVSRKLMRNMAGESGPARDDSADAQHEAGQVCYGRHSATVDTVSALVGHAVHSYHAERSAA